MQIINFGSLNIDKTYRLDHLVKPGETISSDSLTVSCGGKGLNQSIALARAGASVIHAGKVGTDGALLLDALHGHVLADGLGAVHEVKVVVCPLIL